MTSHVVITDTAQSERMSQMCTAPASVQLSVF
jgi:hypothetical protein